MGGVAFGGYNKKAKRNAKGQFVKKSPRRAGSKSPRRAGSKSPRRASSKSPRRRH
jgi:hypothetical protein